MRRLLPFALLAFGCASLRGEEPPKAAAPPPAPAPAVPEFLNRPLAPGRWVEYEAKGLPGVEPEETLAIRFANLGEAEKGGRKVATVEMRVVSALGGQTCFFRCEADAAKVVPLENPFAEAKEIVSQTKHFEPLLLDEEYIEKQKSGKGARSRFLRFATQRNGVAPFLRDVDWRAAGKERALGVEASAWEGTRRAGADPAWSLARLRLLESAEVPLGIAGLEAGGEWRREGEERPIPFDSRMRLLGFGDGAKTEIDGKPMPPPPADEGSP